MGRAALSYGAVSKVSHSHRPVAPVFLDVSGRRWRRVRAVGLGLGIFTTIVGGTVVLSLLVPPLIPRLATNPVKLNITPRIATSKAERAQMEKKLELWFALERQHAPPSLRPSELPVDKRVQAKSPRKPGDPIIVGFYVNWDDNSTAALRDHADDLDWVVCEWAFVANGGDSLLMKIDRRVQYTINQVISDPSQRPAVFLMVSNYDQITHKWDPQSLRHLLTDRTARQRAVDQLTDSVTHYGLAGVTIDFEEVPGELPVRCGRASRARSPPRSRRADAASRRPSRSTTPTISSPATPRRTITSSSCSTTSTTATATPGPSRARIGTSPRRSGCSSSSPPTRRSSPSARTATTGTTATPCPTGRRSPSRR